MMITMDVTESGARLRALMTLMAHAGAEGRADAVSDLEADLETWKRHGDERGVDVGWIVDETRRAIEIIDARTTVKPEPADQAVDAG